MLTNSLKISDITKTEFIQHFSFQKHQKILKKYYRTDLSTDNSLSDP